MYQTHPGLTEIEESSKLWRYMDLSKFISLLENKALYFCPLSLFTDPYEGQPPKPLIEPLISEPCRNNRQEYEKKAEIVKNNLAMFKRAHELVCSSCWHINETESAGMWSQYLKTGEGIAIQTTFSKLKASIQQSSTEVSGAKVQYEDFDTFNPKGLNILHWASFKRLSFEHEQEFRLLAFTPGPSKGLYVEANPELMIEKVYLAPTTPSWIAELVAAVIARYGYKFETINSSLFSTPEYMELPQWVKNG